MTLLIKRSELTWLLGNGLTDRPRGPRRHPVGGGVWGLQPTIEASDPQLVSQRVSGTLDPTILRHFSRRIRKWQREASDPQLVSQRVTAALDPITLRHFSRRIRKWRREASDPPLVSQRVWAPDASCASLSGGSPPASSDPTLHLCCCAAAFLLCFCCFLQIPMHSRCFPAQTMCKAIRNPLCRPRNEFSYFCKETGSAR